MDVKHQLVRTAHCCKKTEVTWLIEDFKNALKAQGRVLCPFRFAHHDWEANVSWTDGKNIALSLRLGPSGANPRAPILALTVNFLTKYHTRGKEGDHLTLGDLVCPPHTSRKNWNGEGYQFPYDAFCASNCSADGSVQIAVQLQIWYDQQHERLFAEAYERRSLLGLFDEQFDVDVTVRLADGDVGAHGAVLSHMSPVFRGALEASKVREGDGGTRELPLPDFDTATFRAVVRTCYQGPLEIPDDTARLVKMLQFAHRYDLQTAETDLQDALCRRITVENVLVAARAWGCTDKSAQQHMIAFVGEHFTQVSAVASLLDAKEGNNEASRALEMFQAFLRLRDA